MIPGGLHAAKITVEPNSISLEGWIVEGDARKVVAAYRNRNVRWLRMSSNGGDVETGLKIADYVGHHRIHVLVTDECLSACAYAAFVALGSRALLVGDHAWIGIHRTYDTATGVPTPDWDLEVVKRMRHAGAPPKPLKDMLATTSDTMKMYGSEELIRMGGVEWGN
jgi:hypothetical protein